MEMDILSLLDSVKEDVLIKRHPLSDEDLLLRFAYAVGVGVVARADGPLNENEQAALKELAVGLLIPEEQIEKVLSAAATPDKATITTVLGALTKREQQYLFLLDLRAMANRDDSADEKEQKAIEQFAAMFKMSGAEIALWRKLDEAVFAEDFAGSEKLFGTVYPGKVGTVTEKTGTEAYRALVYFWRSEAVRDELALREREVAGLESKLKDAVAATKRLGDRPSPRYYRIGNITGNRIYVGEEPCDSHHKTTRDECGNADDSAGERWDTSNKVAKENEMQFSLLITAAKARRDLIASAIDGMYINNEI